MRCWRHVGGRSQRVPIVACLSKSEPPVILTTSTNVMILLSRSFLLGAQRNSKAKAASTLADDDRLLCMIWSVLFSDLSVDVRVKLLTFMCADQTGHGGRNGTEAILREEYIRGGLIMDCKNFVEKFVLCMLSRSASYVSRQLSTLVYDSSPNNNLHFDHLFLGTGENSLNYILVLKGDFSEHY